VYSAMCFFVPADFVSHRTLKDQIGTMILSFKYGAWFFAEQLANFGGWSSVVLLATVIAMPTHQSMPYVHIFRLSVCKICHTNVSDV
jgi:hypothetical protein